MEIQTNAFKRAILAGDRQIGLWSTLGSITALEMIAPAGFDWIVLDTEHAPNELPDVIGQMRVLPGGKRRAGRPSGLDRHRADQALPGCRGPTPANRKSVG